jgi:hypothetical protein
VTSRQNDECRAIKFMSAFQRVAILSVCVVAMSSCAGDEIEKERLTSPDGKVDAIVTESDCGAPCSFVYEVSLAPTRSHSGKRVAYLDAATHGKGEWGVTLRWLDSTTLSVEYVKADSANLEKETLTVAGDTINTVLQKQLVNPDQPASAPPAR